MPCFVAILCAGIPLIALGIAALGWSLTGIGIIWLLVFSYFAALAGSRQFRRMLAFFFVRNRRALLVWIGFEIGGTGLPIALGYALRLIGEADSHPLRHGDLFLVSAVLCFFGVGQLMLIPGTSQRRGSAVGLIVGTIIFGMIDVAAFNGVSAVKHPPNAGINALSLTLYALSGGLALACSLVAESGKLSVPATSQGGEEGNHG